MKVELLGPVRVDGDVDALSPRDRTVLAALAVTRDGGSSVDRLSHALWGDEAPASRVKIVQGCVSRLRRSLGSSAITTRPDGYRLALGGDDVDIRQFERHLERGRELLHLGEPDHAVHALDDALALWRGAPLTDLDDWEHGQVERARLADLRSRAEELRVEAMLLAGRPRDALAPAAQLVREDRLRELRWGLLARAQYQVGDQAAALATLQHARTIIVDELGLDPGSALDELQQQILTHDAQLSAPDAATVVGACPYPGLLPFGEDDAEEFFGREQEIASALERLRREGSLVVVGPSGSGKSSLVRAGIAARLSRDGRRVLVAGPGERPQDVVRDGRPGDVLVVDQVETLLAADVPADERGSTRAALAAWALRGSLVLVIRSDRLADVAAPPLADLVERSLYLLGPMGPDELRAAVEGPARRAGLLVEPGLTDLLVNELEGEPGALPLLSHVLRSTWTRREGRTLTVAGYRAAGGVRGAIAQTAEDRHRQLTDGEQERLRGLLMRLVVRDDEGSLVATPVPRSVFDGDDVLAGVVEMLASDRLVTVDDAHVRLAHEALTRAWPRLASWLREDVAGQRVLQHLSTAASTWDDMGRPGSELYRGVRLTDAESWRDRTRPHLTSVEVEFLDAGLARRRGDERAALERTEQTARTNVRLRRRLAVVAVLTVVALVSAVVATTQSQRAVREATAADARRLSAQALVTDHADTSLLLAVEGVRRDDSPDTRANLLAALGRRPALKGVVRPEGGGEIGTVSVSPDGELVATYDETNTLRFHSMSTRQLVREIHYDDDAMATVEAVDGTTPLITGRAVFHPSGGAVAVGVATLGARPVRLLDPASLEELPTQPGGLPGGNLLPWDVAWSPDGRRLAVVVDRYGVDRPQPTAVGSLAVIWDTSALSDPVIVELPRRTHSLVWGTDGAVLYTAVDPDLSTDREDARTMVWDVASGEQVGELPGITHPLTITPDRRTLVGTAPVAAGAAPAGGRMPVAVEGDVVAVDVASGEEVGRATQVDGPVLAVAVSPDGDAIATSSVDGSVTLHDRRTGARIETLDGHTGAVLDLDFVGDGTTLVSVGTDRAALLWDLTGHDRLLRTVSRSDARPIHGVGIAPDPFGLVSPSGRTVAYVSQTLNESGTPYTQIQLLDVPTGRLLDGGRVVLAHRVRPSWIGGERLAVVNGQGIRTIDGRTGVVGDTGRVPQANSIAVAVDVDEIVLVADSIGHVQQLRGDSLTPLGTPTVIEGLEAAGLRVTPQSRPAMDVTADGRLAAAFGGAFDRDAQFGVVQPPSDRLLLVDVFGARLERAVALGFDGLVSAFSPDDETIAVVGRQGRLALVDVDTGRVVSPATPVHAGDVVSVAWTGDGTRVATGGEEGRLGLWDGRTGESLGSVQVARPGDSSFVGVVDDHTIVAATSAGTVHTLDTRVERWVEVACAVAGRDLTRAEWREALGDEPYRASCASR